MEINNNIIDEISNESAIDAVRLLGEKWLNNKPLEAFKAYYYLVEKNGETYKNLPEWFRNDPYGSEEAGEFARSILKLLSDTEDSDYSKWGKDVMETVSENKAHVLDPITIAVIGTFSIGIILALRVKDIKKGTFYQGFPKEFADTIKSIVSVFPEGKQ